LVRPAKATRHLLVTGGAGYIGSHIARHLVTLGHEVTVLDNLEHGNRAAIPGCRLVRADVRDERRVAGLLAERPVHGIIHLAARKSVEESIVDPAAYFDTNVVGTLALARAAVGGGVPWIVFSSTAAVYGQPTSLPVTEEAPLTPENPYGESKLMAERILDWLGRSRPIRTVSLRYFNAAGASDDGAYGEDPMDVRNLLPLVIRAALGQAGPVQVFGTDYPTPDGTAIRDYIHVADLADAHIRAIDHLEAGGTSAVLNVGTGRGISVREVLDAVAAVAGHPVPAAFVGRRTGDPAAIWADPSRAGAVLGWSARRDLDSIVATAWRWHQRHPLGYRRVPARTADQGP
jgi:UDP-glucose-4-epimerase GalE